MQIIQKMRKQRGSITLLGIGSIVISLFAFSSVVDYGNAKILDRQFDHYAKDIAAVALRSELALTVNMDGSVLDLVTGEYPDRKTYTSLTVDKLLSQVGVSVYDSKNFEKKIKFGNIVNDTFVALPENVASNPKGSDDFIQFSAVAVQIWSKADSSFGLTPQGKAIYGLPEAAANSTDAADCFCDTRYQACLVAEPNMDLYKVVPTPYTDTTPAQIMGVANSDERKNYCDYGYVQSQIPNNDTKAKFPSVELSSQWLGKTAEGVNTLINLNNTAQMENLAIVSNQQPLFVQAGVNPFQTKTWNFWKFFWFNSDPVYIARDWDGTVYEKSDMNSELRAPYFFNYGDVKVDGYFYVGRKATCTAGTTTDNAPGLELAQGYDLDSAAGVQRCLSYSVQSGTTNTEVTCSFMEMMNPDCWDGFKTVEVATYDYSQQSCRDFNSNVKTKMNFFQWMMSLFFGPFTSIDTSYKQLDCSVKKMQHFNINLPFLGTFTWKVV